MIKKYTSFKKLIFLKNFQNLCLKTVGKLHFVQGGGLIGHVVEFLTLKLTVWEICNGSARILPNNKRFADDILEKNV